MKKQKQKLKNDRVRNNKETRAKISKWQSKEPLKKLEQKFQNDRVRNNEETRAKTSKWQSKEQWRNFIKMTE